MKESRPIGENANSTTRPKDRKAKIISVAAELFHENGYPGTSMAGIARRVGVSPGALYRHFTSKRVLLYAVLLSEVTYVRAGIRDDEPRLEMVLDDFTRVAVQHPGVGLLWQREMRHLNSGERHVVRGAIREIASLIASAIVAGAPQMDEGEADLRSWAALSVFAGQRYVTGSVAVNAAFGTLREAVGRVCAVALRVADAHQESSAVISLRRTSRQERILAAAVRLFNENGFQLTSMEEIGAEVGISGPSIYSYFSSKIDILVAAMTRATSTLQVDLDRAFDTAEGPRSAIEALLASYVSLAVDNSDLSGVILYEFESLPSKNRLQLLQLLHDYIGEWVHLLMLCEPKCSQLEAQARVLAALGIVNFLGQTPHLRFRPGFREELLALSGAALFNDRLALITPAK